MKYFIFLFFISSLNIYAQDNILKINKESGMIENLTYKNIKEIQQSNILGDLVDMYSPTKLINCYIFHFKKGTTIYQIAALPENDSTQKSLKNTDLTQFIAIGYYGILYSDGKKINMFRGPGNQTPFDFLHNINPENYVSIRELEIMIGVNFNLADKGGFLSPFYLFSYYSKNWKLTILASPSEDKTKSFFMGGWSFEQWTQE